MGSPRKCVDVRVKDYVVFSPNFYTFLGTSYGLIDGLRNFFYIQCNVSIIIFLGKTSKSGVLTRFDF